MKIFGRETGKTDQNSRDAQNIDCKNEYGDSGNFSKTELQPVSYCTFYVNGQPVSVISASCQDDGQRCNECSNKRECHDKHYQSERTHGYGLIYFDKFHCIHAYEKLDNNGPEHHDGQTHNQRYLEYAAFEKPDEFDLYEVAKHYAISRFLITKSPDKYVSTK